MKYSILLVDNDNDFLLARKEFFDEDQFQIFLANDAVTAEYVMEKNDIDIILIDLRLINDEDDQDTSGIELAKNISESIPKILLTAFPSIEIALTALKTNLNGIPLFYDLILKSEGPEKMLNSIFKLLNLNNQYNELRLQRNKSNNELVEHYKELSVIVRKYNKFGFITSIICIVFIFIAVIFFLLNIIQIGAVSSLLSILSGAACSFIFKRSDILTKQLKNFQTHQINTYIENRILFLKTLCDDLHSSHAQDECRKMIIELASKLAVSRPNENLKIN